MPRQLNIKTIKSVAFVFFFIAVGFFAARFHEQDGVVEFSSSAPKITTGKLLIEHSNTVGKHMALLQSQIRAIELPEDDRDEASLEALVTLTQAIDGSVTYKLIWDKDSGVEAVSDIIGYLDPQLVGVQQKIEFKLRRFSRSERKIVTFLVEAQRDGHVYGSTALVSSRPEDSMEYIAPEKMESALKFQRDKKSVRDVSSINKK